MLARSGTLVGYGNDALTYKIWDGTSTQFYLSRDVVIDERLVGLYNIPISTLQIPPQSTLEFPPEIDSNDGNPLSLPVDNSPVLLADSSSSSSTSAVTTSVSRELNGLNSSLGGYWTLGHRDRRAEPVTTNDSVSVTMDGLLAVDDVPRHYG